MPPRVRPTPTALVASVNPVTAPAIALRFTLGAGRSAGGAPPGRRWRGAGVSAVSTIETSPFLLVAT